MEKWIQKLSGALIASVLALTLSSKASADLLEDDPDPDQPLPQYEENIDEETLPPTRGVSSDDDETPVNDGDETPVLSRGASGNDEEEDDGEDESGDTGDVEGSLLSEKIFYTETSIGNIRVPKGTSGGMCEVETDTGDISFTIIE